jgi:hypothetical protein
MMTMENLADTVKTGKEIEIIFLVDEIRDEWHLMLIKSLLNFFRIQSIIDENITYPVLNKLDAITIDNIFRTNNCKFKLLTSEAKNITDEKLKWSSKSPETFSSAIDNINLSMDNDYYRKIDSLIATAFLNKDLSVETFIIIISDKCGMKTYRNNSLLNGLINSSNKVSSNTTVLYLQMSNRAMKIIHFHELGERLCKRDLPNQNINTDVCVSSTKTTRKIIKKLNREIRIYMSNIDNNVKSENGLLIPQLLRG